MAEQREVPYYTTEDPALFCGHIYRARKDSNPSGPWGYQWAVYAPYSADTDPVAGGWRATQRAAESSMQSVLEEKVKA